MDLEQEEDLLDYGGHEGALEQNKERPRVVGQRDDGPEAEGRGAVRERKASHENQGCAPAGVGCEVREHEERGEHQRHHRALPLIIFI